MSRFVQPWQFLERFRILSMLGLLARYGSEDEIEARLTSTGASPTHAKLH